jgi:hypothetical protein
MKTAFAMLAGVAIGALAIQGLHAQQTGAQQQMPKVIYVAEIDVSNPEGYRSFVAPIATTKLIIPGHDRSRRLEPVPGEGAKTLTMRLGLLGGSTRRVAG